MRVWRVTFHWLGKESGSVDVVADNTTLASGYALQIERKKGCLYKDENVIKIELISEPEVISV